MGALRNRPWLLVVVAFTVLIGAWTAIILISIRHPAIRVTPAEEAALLQRAEASR